jgi:hypothetical protein
MKRLQPDGTGPRAYWNAMKALTTRRGSFSWDDVAEVVPGVVRNTIQSYIAACLRAGHVTIVGERRARRRSGPDRKLYAVNVNRSEAPFEKPELTKGDLGTKQRHLWTAIRAMPTFTVRDLTLQASTDDVVISEIWARGYVRCLSEAGYLLTLGRSETRFVVYRLRPSHNTGPLPPAVSADGTVTDRNPVRRRRAA